MSGNYEPLAIIGLSCRFPGEAVNLQSFWQMLLDSRCEWTDVPSDRWNWKSFYHPSPENPGTTDHRGGHFLSEDIAGFDAQFFGISPLEASAIDPQQRLQLESSYEALESAGLSLESIKGSKCGVFIATFTHDYDTMFSKDLANTPKYVMTGTGQAIAANRISYLFDLKGPSMVVDTGCSGSLVALHQACRSLHSKESNMAIVGATNLMLTPDNTLVMSNLRYMPFPFSEEYINITRVDPQLTGT
jgi:acyl transferase domain-containing protein